MPRGGQRSYERLVMVQRGRRVRSGLPPSLKRAEGPPSSSGAAKLTARELMMDQARNRQYVTRLIHHHGRLRRAVSFRTLSAQSRTSSTEQSPPAPALHLREPTVDAALEGED